MRTATARARATAAARVRGTETTRAKRTATADAKTAVAKEAATAKILGQFAWPVMNFGRSGIGPGQFSDGRYIAVDGNGNIYVAEHDEGSRVQKFDPTGKFVSFWNPADPKAIVTDLAADRQGNVYVLQGGRLARYAGESGERLTQFEYEGSSAGFDDATVAPDGSVATVWRNGWDQKIIRFDAQGKVIQVIDEAITGQLDGDIELQPHIAVDGLGNIYIFGEFEKTVFKYAPSGAFWDRFGSKGHGPGLFNAPADIAVDGQGHIYIADGRTIHVFDSDGRFLDDFKVDGVASGLALNDQDELLVVVRDEVIKFVMNKDNAGD